MGNVKVKMTLPLPVGEALRARAAEVGMEPGDWLKALLSMACTGDQVVRLNLVPERPAMGQPELPLEG